MSKLKIKIIGKGTSEGRGVGFYEENLVKALKKKAQVQIVDNNSDIDHFVFYDIFYKTLPSKFPRPTVVTVHDLTPLVLSSRYPKGILSSINMVRQWFALRKVDAIITDSESSKRDLIKIFRIPEEKIFVTHLAVSDSFHKTATKEDKERVSKKYNLPEKFIISAPGGPDPNKNLPNLAEVTERLGIPLVIVGSRLVEKIQKPVPPELIDMVRLQVYPHVIRPGFVSNEDLNVMYRMATCHVQASLYEGFGLPLLESMTVGCPAISSNTSSLPEVYHKDTITFNPQSLKSMEKALTKFLKLTPKQKASYIEINKIKASEFTWKKTANLTTKVYQHVYEKYH